MAWVASYERILAAIWSFKWSLRFFNVFSSSYSSSDTWLFAESSVSRDSH